MPIKIATSWYISNFWANPNDIDMVAVSHCIPMISSFMVYLWFIFITINHHKPMPNATGTLWGPGTSCTCRTLSEQPHHAQQRARWVQVWGPNAMAAVKSSKHDSGRLRGPMSHETGGYFKDKLFRLTMVIYSMVVVSKRTFHHPNHLFFLADWT